MWRLSHTVLENSPCWPCRPCFELQTTSPGGGWSIQTLQAPLCAGTHLDAPRHCRGTMTVECFPEAQWTSAWVYRLDNAEDTPVISQKALQLWWEHLGCPDCEGHWLLVQTGWGRYFEDPARYRGLGPQPHAYPHLEAACADWILERKFAGLAVDTLSPDSVEAFPLHEALLPAGCWIVENLRYEPALPVHCQILLCPIRWTGATETSLVVLAKP